MIELDLSRNFARASGVTRLWGLVSSKVVFLGTDRFRVGTRSVLFLLDLGVVDVVVDT